MPLPLSSSRDAPPPPLETQPLQQISDTLLLSRHTPSNKEGTPSSSQDAPPPTEKRGHSNREGTPSSSRNAPPPTEKGPPPPLETHPLQQRSDPLLLSRCTPSSAKFSIRILALFTSHTHVAKCMWYGHNEMYAVAFFVGHLLAH